MPIFFSDEESLTVGGSFINKLRTHLKSDAKGSNCALIALQGELFITIDFETDVNVSLLYEIYLTEFFKLSLDEGALLKADGFQSFECRHHEISVIFVIPGKVLPNVFKTQSTIV